MILCLEFFINYILIYNFFMEIESLARVRNLRDKKWSTLNFYFAGMYIIDYSIFLWNVSLCIIKLLYKYNDFLTTEYFKLFSVFSELCFFNCSWSSASKFFNFSFIQFYSFNKSSYYKLNEIVSRTWILKCRKKFLSVVICFILIYIQFIKFFYKKLFQIFSFLNKNYSFRQWANTISFKGNQGRTLNFL